MTMPDLEYYKKRLATAQGYDDISLIPYMMQSEEWIIKLGFADICWTLAQHGVSRNDVGGLLDDIQKAMKGE
jgi:hypothetical protein